MAASLIILLAGGWLILAPFALGYQPYGADWVNQTTNDFWVGIPVAVVALVSFMLFFVSLIASLRAAGVLLAQPRLQQQALTMAPGPAMMQTPSPVAPAVYESQSDLDRTLATLAAALAADLNNRRQAQASSDQQSDQTISNRRDV
jgi:ABC-type multidrug transport system fused ATPase/permease subunit